MGFDPATSRVTDCSINHSGPYTTQGLIISNTINFLIVSDLISEEEQIRSRKNQVKGENSLEKRNRKNYPELKRKTVKAKILQYATR